MAYPQAGATGVRGLVERLFVIPDSSPWHPGEIFGGTVRANWQDWELPGANDFTYFYYSPLVFNFSGITHGLREGQACTFDVLQSGPAFVATNVQPA